jgi:biotin/methionine sulfoxide reductase
VSQIHRFLAVIGGYTSSVNTYSLAAGEVIVPHVVGLDVFEGQPSWQEISDNTQLFVTFGGIALKNAQVNPGGHGRHTTRDWLGTCRDRGAEFVNVSPLRDDMVETIDAEWIPARPNTDTAIMLGLAHSLIVEGLHDRRFIDRYCVGWDQLEKYLLGFEDDQPKTAEWAGAVADVAPARIRELARRMAGSRTFINVSWSVQRAHHGEQPYWMAIALAAPFQASALEKNAALVFVLHPRAVRTRTRILDQTLPVLSTTKHPALGKSSLGRHEVLRLGNRTSGLRPNI